VIADRALVVLLFIETFCFSFTFSLLFMTQSTWPRQVTSNGARIAKISCVFFSTATVAVSGVGPCRAHEPLAGICF
jgi:hypothetical protein